MFYPCIGLGEPVLDWVVVINNGSIQIQTKLEIKLKKLLKVWRRITQTKQEKWLEKQRTIGAHMVWKDQPFYRNALEKYGLSVAGIPEIRCFFLQSCIRSLHRLDGDVIECGTRKGKSALYMLEACEAKREIFLFDSFEGLSDPVEGKDTIKNVFEKDGKTRIFNENFVEITERFESYSNVHLMKGWIPDRFAEVENRKIALLHVDVDMYQPTLDSFEFFYEKMVPGGIIICDDYGSGAYPGARDAMDSFFANKPESPIELPQGQAFVIKQQISPQR